MFAKLIQYHTIRIVTGGTGQQNQPIFFRQWFSICPIKGGNPKGELESLHGFLNFGVSD